MSIQQHNEYNIEVEKSHYRAGRYIRQATGYRAFIPAPLPPRPAPDLSQLLTELLAAQQAVGQLEGIAGTLPNVDLLTLMYVRAEAVLSSQIEGTQASLDDVLRAEAKLQTPNDPDDVQEVINYISALDFSLKRMEELPLSLRLIREVHQQLMQGVRGGERQPGEFRRTQNWIGNAGATLQTARFVPPPPAEMQDALGNLENFIYEEASNLPELIKIGLLHAQFETIHPFLDGNGRTGRLLITLLLCHYGLLSQPLLYLSFYFKQHRNEYYDRLQAVRDRGDWEGWLLFYLRGVSQVAAEAARTARAAYNLREQDRIRVSEQLGNKAGNALALLERLYQSPYINVMTVQQHLGVSYATANSLVKDLEELNILHPIDDRKRDRIFYHRHYVDTFRVT